MRSDAGFSMLSHVLDHSRDKDCMSFIGCREFRNREEGSQIGNYKWEIARSEFRDQAALIWQISIGKRQSELESVN